MTVAKRGWQWIGRAIAIAGALALAPACFLDGGASVETACEHGCECFYFLPSEQRACVDECVPDLSSAPQECIDCVANTACRECEADSCEDECSGAWQRLMPE